MAEHDQPRLHPEALGDRTGNLARAARARPLRDHDYRRTLAAELAILDSPAHLVEVKRDLRHDYQFGAPADRYRQRDKSRVAPHHLDEKEPVAGERRIANPVDRLQR